MKNILFKIAPIVLLFTLILSACSTRLSEEPLPKEPLNLTQYTYNVNTGNGIIYPRLIDSSKEPGVVEYDEVATMQNLNLTATSLDESLATIEGSRIQIGNKTGTVKILIETPEKSATLTVNILSSADYIKEQYKEDDSILNSLDWFLYNWTVNNIESFKDPASVSFTDTFYYHKDESGNIEYLLVEYRAKNSFGGYTTSYFHVNVYSIQQIDWTPSFIGASYYGEKIYKGFPSTIVKKALAEYIEKNY